MPTTVPRMDATFGFNAELYEWDARSDSSWVFATVSAEISEDVRDMELPRKGFGSVKVTVRCGESEWRTSIFPDSKTGCYVLPVKKDIRRREKIDVGDIVDFEIDIAPE
ncbi:MAG: hypothetical protein ACI9C1_002643 [Candidatus Aldehydirespiratoraceae bacterium]|jgi:hypothetical protein